MAQTQNTVSIQITAEDKASAVFKSHAAALAHAQEGYESLTDYMKREAAEAQRAAAATSSASEAVDKAGRTADSAGLGFSSLFKSFTLANLASSAIQSGAQMINQSLKDGVQAAADYERSVVGLNGALGTFGVSSDQADAAIQSLTSDGLLTFAQVATATKNLLSTGMDFDTAVKLMERFKDEASFGRVETIKYGDAFVNLSEAMMTGSSQMGNLNGHAANMSDALEIGAASMGKLTSNMTDSEKVQATVIGYMQQGAYTAGDAAKYMDTYAGTVSKMETESQKASISLGQLLLPALQYASTSFTDILTTVTGSSQGLETFQGILVGVAMTIRMIVQASFAPLQLLIGGFQSLASMSFDPLLKSADTVATGFVDAWQDASDAWTDITNKNDDLAKKAAQNRVDYETAAAKKVRQQEEEENRQYARAVQQRAKQFAESLRDMVIAHRDKSRSIQADIAKEDQTYAQSALKRQKDYQEDLASLEEGHLDKVSDIQEQIADLRASGLEVDGVLYQAANEEKIQKLEEQLDKENASYQKSVDKRKAQYDEDVAEDKARHDEKLAQLQTALAEEMAILEKHRADVSAVGEAQKEDDLSRLKRQFAEANAEAARNHQEQLAKIRNNGTAIGGAYADGVKEGVKDAPKSLKDSIQQGIDQGAIVAGNGGTKSADDMWTNFKGSIKANFANFGNVLYDTIQSQFSGEAGKRFATVLNAIPVVGPALSSMAAILNQLPKREGGGSVSRGRPYVVGEKEAEVFVPDQSGRILNQDQLRSALGGSAKAGPSVTIGSVILQNSMDMDSFLSSLSWHIN